MRTQRWIAVFVLAFATSLVGDEASVKRDISAVEQELPSLERMTPTLIVGTDGGGEIEAWVREGRPRKIVVWVLLSSRELKTTFYFANEKLAAVLQHERWFAWNSTLGQLEPSRTARLVETDCVFDTGALVDQASRVREGIETRVVPKEKGTELQRLADFFKKAITERQTSIDAEELLKGR